MSCSKYKHLFEPITLGKTLFKHRIFASPQDHPDLTANLQLTAEARAFYELKALGGFASVNVGDFMVEKRVTATPGSWTVTETLVRLPCSARQMLLHVTAQLRLSS